MVPTYSTLDTTRADIPATAGNSDARTLGTPPTDFWSARWQGYLRAPSGEEVTLTVRLNPAADFVGVCLDGAHLIGGPEWRPNVKPRAILELFVKFNLQYISIESF